MNFFVRVIDNKVMQHKENTQQGYLSFITPFKFEIERLLLPSTLLT